MRTVGKLLESAQRYVFKAVSYLIANVATTLRPRLISGQLRLPTALVRGRGPAGAGLRYCPCSYSSFLS
jgi:hypothetical protein